MFQLFQFARISLRKVPLDIGLLGAKLIPIPRQIGSAEFPFEVTNFRATFGYAGGMTAWMWSVGRDVNSSR
jgi:hypothetical protein